MDLPLLGCCQHLGSPIAGRAPATIRVGTDFSGLETPIYAMLLLNIVFRQEFSCDSCRNAREIAQHLGSRCIYGHIEGRELSSVSQVDLYVAGPPCQAFSAAGRRAGINDPTNGACILHSIAYIGAKKPTVFLLEEVVEIMTQHAELWNFITSSLRGYGYHLTPLTLNALQFGLPQRRERLYLAGSLVKPMDFVMPGFENVTLAKIVSPLPSDAFQILPPEEDARRRSVVEAELAKRIEQGVNPFVTCITINSGSSLGRASSTIDTIMTLTRTECGKRGYWCTTKGDYLSVDELAMCQGFPSGLVPYSRLGISEFGFAQLVGNAMALPILMVLIPQLLLAGDMLSEEACRACLLRAVKFEPFARGS